MLQRADTSERGPFQERVRKGVCIKVVGVGDGASNAINRMIDRELQGVQFISANTDLQSLNSSRAQVKLQLGAHITHGLGAGADSEVGRKAALGDSDKILESLTGAEAIIIAAGLGGGTGTGAAPVIASIASATGALTVAVVTLPFGFEGRRKMNQAKQGLQHFLGHVDTLIVIPSDPLLVSGTGIESFETFRVADDALLQAVQGIADIITLPDVIHRDFADVRKTMAGMGSGSMGTASSSGPNRASEAARGALASPLLDDEAIAGARCILIHIAGSDLLKLSEVHVVCTIIQQMAHEEAEVILVAVRDDALGAEIRVTTIAIGRYQEGSSRAERSTPMPVEGDRRAIEVTTQPQPSPERASKTEGRSVVKRASRPSAPPASLIQSSIQPPAERPSLPPSRHGPHYAELTQTRAGSQDFSSISPVRQSQAPLAPRTLDAFPIAAPLNEEDLLACIEGLPFDVTAQTDRAASSRAQEELIREEITRVRRNALAAYATFYRAENISPEPLPAEAADFAAILRSRQEVFSAQEDESHQRLREEDEEETAQNRSSTASADGLSHTDAVHNAEEAYGSQSAFPQKTDVDVVCTTASLSHFDVGPPALKAEAVRMLPIKTSMSDDPPAPPQGTKTLPRDFNQRLNRQPDFSMGLKKL